MTIKYTPGRWEIYYQLGKATSVVCKGYGGRICNGPYGNPEAMKMFNANARLIAAAPELLNNLKIVTEQLRQIDAVTDDENPAMSQDMLDAFHGIEFNISEAEQAITEAEGE